MKLKELNLEYCQSNKSMKLFLRKVNSLSIIFPELTFTGNYIDIQEEMFEKEDILISYFNI